MPVVRRVVAFVLPFVVLIGTSAACGSGRTGGAGAETPAPARVFGISTDPWHIDEWASAVGAAPTMVMEFEAWSRNRTIDSHFEQARRQGIGAFMLTWEPWTVVSAAKGKPAQYAEQPEFANAAIAAGRKDGYIRAMAESVAASGLLVYVRYAHEMNGDWYPWSRDPASYVAAWRHVVDIFRAAGATNARFVFSVNPSLFVPAASWAANVRRYWPGDEYVDLLGTTMINFGGRKDYPVAEFVGRFEQARSIFHKNLIVTEMNTSADGRVRWLTDLRTWLDTAGRSWVDGVTISQGESRGAIQLGSGVGDLSWNVASDPATQPVVRAIINDFRAS